MYKFYISNSLLAANVGLACLFIANPALAQRITSPGLTTPSPIAPSPKPSTSSPSPKPTAPSPKPTPASPPSQQVTNRGGTPITAAERQKLTSYLQQQGIGIPSQVSGLNSPTFILHDTSILLSSSQLERELREGRGPLGLGVNVYVPRSSNAVVARPNFYEMRRPTTTEFEKGSDILSRSERERLMRQVWSSANSSSRSQGLNLALANLRLTPSEQKKEQAAAAKQLGSSGDKVFTTATWTIEQICNRHSQGDRSMAINSASMSSACDRLSGYFRTRNERVRSSIAVEILQVGARSEKGNQNTCDPRNSNIADLPSPPYSDTQYKNVLNNYARATLMAGVYPKITTHFALDARLPEAHCDPRCFDLTRLYHAISTISGHPRGTSYGIIPSYGMSGGSNNLWWDNRTCHGAPAKL
jgi:hypothetical protein